MPPRITRRTRLAATKCAATLSLLLVRELAAELGLQHLAVIVLGQRFDESVLARPLVPADVVETDGVERRRRYRLAGAGDHEGDHLLTPLAVRPPHHRRFQHARMPQQHLLDLPRIDVAASA